MSQSTQSSGLSKRHKERAKKGDKLNTDSKKSEKILTHASRLIIRYVKRKYGKDVKWIKEMKIDDVSARVPGIPHFNDKRCSFKPDGGIMFIDDKVLLISEDKKQGSNDILFARGEKKQGTGNAVERALKNINIAETLCLPQSTFPYVIFAAGCDLHHSETISGRIKAANNCYPINYREVTSSKRKSIRNILMNSDIDVRKRHMWDTKLSVFTPFFSGHKYNEMPHGSSDFSLIEVYVLLKRVIDESISEFL